MREKKIEQKLVSQSTKSETKTSTAFKTQTSEAVRLQGLRP